MNVLVITSENPFPARNGVTIPVANYTRLLKEMGYQVDILIFQSGEAGIHSEQTGVVGFVKLQRVTWKALIEEVVLKRHIYSTNFTFDISEVNKLVGNTNYDLIISSPISMTLVAEKCTRYLMASTSPHVKHVTAISDCLSAEIFNSGLNNSTKLNVKSKFRALMSCLRFWAVKKIEPALLKNCYAVLVQSTRDKAWLRKIGGTNLSKKTYILTNGVDEALLDIPISERASAHTFCFVADLNIDHYFHNLCWLYEWVWSKIPNTDVILKLHTKRIIDTKKRNFIGSIMLDKRVHLCEDFVPDLADLYKGIDVALAPIFKSYGFINKVAEAMASGIVVVGDRTAFNGMNNFCAGTHGIVFETSEDLIKIICGLIDSTEGDQYLYSIKSNARQFANENFHWANKKSVLEALLS